MRNPDQFRGRPGFIKGDPRDHSPLDRWFLYAASRTVCQAGNLVSWDRKIKLVIKNEKNRRHMNGKQVASPTILESPDLVSFITLKEGIQPKPFVRGSDGRVCFQFSDDVSGAIAAFYGNETVPIADYCQKLKMIRSMIFAMKGGAGHVK